MIMISNTSKISSVYSNFRISWMSYFNNINIDSSFRALLMSIPFKNDDELFDAVIQFDPTIKVKYNNVLPIPLLDDELFEVDIQYQSIEVEYKGVKAFCELLKKKIPTFKDKTDKEQYGILRVLLLDDDFNADGLRNKIIGRLMFPFLFPDPVIPKVRVQGKTLFIYF